MAKRIVDKLVRDNILTHLHDQWKTVKFRHIERDEEKKQKLIEKLWEKYKETFEALIHSHQDQEKIADNLGDMLEVMNKIAHVRNIELSYIVARKDKKNAEKWWYDRWVYIEHIEE